jgi:DNA-binding response OmpR family regulator
VTALDATCHPLPLPKPEHILLVDTDATAAQYNDAALDDLRIALVSRCDAARSLIVRTAPVAVVTELVLPDGAGTELCRAAKALPRPPAVLVITSDQRLIPDALDAGCDGVLLKPFPPNLLFARLRRLLRARSDAVRLGEAARRSPQGSDCAGTRYGTNQYWPDLACPHCDRQGVTSFDFASHRQAWYACLACRTVWSDRRHD